ncbi:unnamed protein product [Alopecurus aequalis]
MFIKPGDILAQPLAELLERWSLVTYWHSHLRKATRRENKGGKIITEELMHRLKGEIPGEIQLETRIGYSHSIVVAKNQKKLVLTVGWTKFVESYDLHMGDSLIFKCNGSSQFNVIIFDNLGREKALSAVVDPFMTQVQDRRRNAHEIGSARNMDGPCVRCKKWLDYHYMNLDDEKKYFLMLMIGDFQHEMIIPEEFVKRFKGEIPGEMILETKNRRIYIIGVAKHQEKLVLTVGWGDFVKNFGLQMGDTIIFRYNGNSKFSVIIFDKLGCENALSVVVEPELVLAPVQERHTNATETVNHSNIHLQPVQIQLNSDSQVLPQLVEIKPSSSRVNGPPMESSPTKRQCHLQMDKSCQEGSFSSEDEYGVQDVSGSNYTAGKKNRLSSSQKEQLKDGYITAHKTKLTSLQMEAVMQKVQTIRSEIPIFVAVMRKSNVDSGYFVTLPSLAKKYLDREPNMYLQLLGEKYAVRLSESLHEKKIVSGWKEFAQDNDLKMGDICLFELWSNQRRTMEVHIIRANDDN